MSFWHLRPDILESSSRPLLCSSLTSIQSKSSQLSLLQEIQRLSTPCHLYCASPAQATSFLTWIKKELPNFGPSFAITNPDLILQPCYPRHSSTYAFLAHMRESRSPYDGLQGSVRNFHLCLLLCGFLLPGYLLPA